MVNLKKCNWFTGDPHDVSSTVYQIVNFLEVDGHNSLLITPPRRTTEHKRASSTSLKYLLDNQLTFDSFQEFCDLLDNKSNLFRVNLLVIDLFSINYGDLWLYKKRIDETDLTHIIVAKEYHYKTTDDVNDFHVRTEYKNLKDNLTYITDNINKWTSSINELKRSYVRNKKIDNLFDIE